MLGKLRSELGARLGSVLDCPVGTGRFLRLYRDLGIRYVTGVDASEEMLALARRKRWSRGVKLEQRDAAKLELHASHDVAVCVRFLDLIDERAMQTVTEGLCRAARHGVILTVRLGPTYVPKVNTATHDERKFRALIRRLGWTVAEEVPIFDAGWRVMLLRRR